MNNFGLDHQSTFTSIALYEESSSQATRMVGDGRQLMIPNVVADGDLWGTQAAMTSGCRPLGGIESAVSDDAIFWRGIASRLFSYLGRMEAVRQNGYGVTAAISGELDADAVASRARHAGLRDFDLITATEALCCREFGSATDLPEPRRTIVAVACGDRSVEIEAFVIERTSSRQPLIVARSGGTTIEQTGHALWSKRLIAELREHLIEPLPTALEWNPDVSLAILRAAERLTRERGSFDWTGGLGRSLFAPVRIALWDCRRWPEAILLEAAMSPAVDDELRKLAAGDADLILVGGIGALWPFAGDAARAIGNIRISSDPASDLAIGASAWKESVQTVTATRPQRRIIQKPPPSEEEGSPEDGEPAVQPPWLKSQDVLPIEE